MTEYEIATLAYQQGAQWIAVGQLAVAVVGVGLVGVGIRAMTETAKRRDRQLDQHRRDQDQRHAESMEALRALIKGMETVIERTEGRA